MKLNSEQIREICQGAVRVNESDTGIQLFRFTAEQEAYYLKTNVNFHKKALAAAGMKLCFETDSRSLFLKVYVTPGSTRTYFSFDVTVDGSIIGHLDNFIEEEVPEIYTTMQGELGEFSKNFDLGEGTKKVCVYLPWSVAVEIREISVDDNAFIKPLKPAKKLLVFGDSITQGYDALRPMNRYAAKLADALGAGEINKGIGAEKFCPQLAKLRDDFEPEYILVAYGTNDWTHLEEADFMVRCSAFYETLSNNYPNSVIWALTPIWRGDCDGERVFGAFDKVAEDMQKITEPFKNIVCINGFDLVPHDDRFFADGRLHPNDKGFACYFEGLWESLKQYVI